MVRRTGLQTRQKRGRQTQAALEILREHLRTIYGANAPQLMLYGSEARGDAKANSDIDLILLYSHAISRGEEIRRLAPVLADLNLTYGLLISVLPVAEDEYKGAAGPFWTNVRREAVVLD